MLKNENICWAPNIASNWANEYRTLHGMVGLFGIAFANCHTQRVI